MKKWTPFTHPAFESLAFESVTFAYATGPAILQSADFRFSTSGVTRLVAALGSGLSTVLKILGGLKTPVSGCYRVNGEDFFAAAPAQRVPLQLSIGFAFDHGGLLSNYTLLNNLTLPINYHQFGPKAERLQRAMAYLEHFGIEDDAHKQPAFVSASARKACVLARSLVLDPRLLLLDEPTNGLGDAHTERLVDLIQYHRRERGLQQVMVSSANTGFLNRFDFQTVELNDKRLVECRQARTGTHGSK